MFHHMKAMPTISKKTNTLLVQMFNRNAIFTEAERQ